MTYAPSTLRELATYWVAHGGVNLGIVGDTRHRLKGTSYHLGRSALTATAYSRQTTRDRQGLTEAASAIDLGRLRGTYPNLRAFSVWLVKECQRNAPGTSDIREVIYTPDGKTVLRYDRERGIPSVPRPGEADASHLFHTHVSWYRDSEQRSKVGVFRPYFAPALPDTSKEAPVGNPLIAAIDKRLGYYQNEVESGDEGAALVHALKAQEFVNRLVVAVAPPAVKAAFAADKADEALSADPSVAIPQILTAMGLPPEFRDGAFIAASPGAILAAASPEQNAQLTLLGMFGTPDDQATFPTADFSLYERFHERAGGGWAPKPEYANGVWAAYVATL